TDIAELMNQAPWWVVSLVIHGILLIVLAAINFSTGGAKRKEVTINTEFVEIEDYERPVVTRNVLSEETVESESVQEVAESNLQDVSTEVPVMRVAPISMNAIAGLVSQGSGFDFNASGTGMGGLLGRVGSGQRYTIKTVVDALAGEILKDIQKHDLLVVMLFDESKSLLEDRKLIARQIQKTVGDLKKEMTPREAQRLKWAVVSYGEKPTMWLQPTGELEKVVEATDKVKVDTTGLENVIDAINFTMKNLGVLRKPMFVVLVTDEEGSDVKKTENVTTALNSMVSSKTRLFVFGREASFQLAQVREWLRDKNGERMGPWGDAERGIESCEYEYFPSDWFWTGQRSYNGVPSGFGCWVQSMLAHQSGGTYYILSDVPSKYDDEMMEEYKPEWEPRDVYVKRTESSRMRSVLSKLFTDYPLTRPSHWITQLERLQAQTKEFNKKAEGMRKLAERAIDDLEPMKSKSRREKYAPKRWQANYDLAMAMLYKLKFIAGEYVQVTNDALRKGFPKPQARQKFNIFSIYYDNKATEAVTGRRGDREMAKARDMLSQVIQEYKGTPWSEIAKHELARTYPLKMTPIFYIEPTRPKL
ncbi:MAG: vWA domain-containing protein, partial [Planctomycetota bacterium]